MVVLRLTIRNKKMGGGAVSGNPFIFPEIIGITLPLISL